MSYLITLAEYHALTGLSASDTSQDTQIDALIAAVDDEIDTYLGWNVVAGTYTETLNGTGNDFIRLRNRPITALTSMTLNYNSTAPTTYSGSDFIYSADQAMVYFNPASSTPALPGYFQQGVLNVQAVYSAGYAVASVPQQIKRAACLLIQRSMFFTSSDAISDIKLDQYAQKSNVVDINAATNADVRAILARWKVVRFVF